MRRAEPWLGRLSALSMSAEPKQPDAPTATFVQPQDAGSPAPDEPSGGQGGTRAASRIERVRARLDRSAQWLSRQASGRVARWGYQALVALMLLGCTAVLASKLVPHYPMRHWLFWIYARIWGWALLFALGCVSAGHLVMGWLMPRGLSLRARAVYSVAVGVLVFFLGMFIAGLLGAFGPVWAVGWPAALAAAGGVPLVRRLRRVRRALAHARRTAGRARWWSWPVAAFGILCVAAIYFAILTPGNVAFDSQFYHLGLAQQYAAEGAIRPSAEGWLSATIPHLASVLYTWALLVPGMPNVERVLLAGHLEFVLFAATLASLPVLVRWLCPGSSSGLAWVAIFLFPGIFLYDASLSTAADHIAAFWAPAIYLAFAQAWNRLEPRRCALLAALLAGAMLTKYQSVQLAILPVLGVGVRALWLVGKSLVRRSPAPWRPLLGPLVAIGVGLVLTSPHWLKNLAWYGDPLYPYLHSIFPARPFSPDAAATFDEYFQGMQVGGWQPKGTTHEKLVETSWALYEFSFIPHDWKKLHGTLPVFGSLFTFSVFVLPLLPKSRRLWGVFIGAHLALFQWYWTMHQDRYLQVVLPWMAAAVAGTIALVWRLGLLPRIGLAALVGLQIVWGGDVYFIPTHAMLGKAPIVATADLLAQGYRHKYKDRLVLSRAYEQIAEKLPPNARVLLHEENRRVGLWRSVVSDFVPWQYGLRWGRMDTAEQMHATLRRMGVTHILWRPSKSRGFDSLAGDLRFFEYVTQFGDSTVRSGSWSITPVSETSPGTGGKKVAYLGCGRFYGQGLYDLGALDVPELWAPKKSPRRKPETALEPGQANLDELIAGADFVVLGTGCKPVVPTSKLADFVQAARRGKEQLWLRRLDDRKVDAIAPDSGAGDDDDGLMLLE